MVKFVYNLSLLTKPSAGNSCRQGGRSDPCLRVIALETILDAWNRRAGKHCPCVSSSPCDESLSESPRASGNNCGLHGTMLISSELRTLGKLLHSSKVPNPSPSTWNGTKTNHQDSFQDTMQTEGVEFVRSPACNLRQHKPDISHDDFVHAVVRGFQDHSGDSEGRVSLDSPTSLTCAYLGQLDGRGWRSRGPRGNREGNARTCKPILLRTEAAWMAGSQPQTWAGNETMRQLRDELEELRRAYRRVEACNQRYVYCSC